MTLKGHLLVSDIGRPPAILECMAHVGRGCFEHVGRWCSAEAAEASRLSLNRCDAVRPKAERSHIGCSAVNEQDGVGVLLLSWSGMMGSDSNRWLRSMNRVNDRAEHQQSSERRF